MPIMAPPQASDPRLTSRRDPRLTPRNQEGEGREGLPPPPNLADLVGRFGAPVGGALGGIAGSFTGPGAIPMAGLGAVGVGAVGRSIQARFGNLPVPGVEEAPQGVVERTTVNLGVAAGVAWDGLIEGLTEGIGRGIFSLVGLGISKLRGAIRPATEKIAEVALPLAAGARTRAGGLVQTLEGYLSDSWVGGQLRMLKEAQQRGFRGITNKLASASAAAPFEMAPDRLAINWARAREATRAVADPIYNNLRGLPTPQVRAVAGELLDDAELSRVIGGRAKNALLDASRGAGQEDLVKLWGFADDADAIRKLGGREAFDRWKARITNDLGKVLGLSTADDSVTFGMSLTAKTALADAAQTASTAGRADDARILWNAAKQIDSAAEAGLTAAQKAEKEVATRLWRQSYIMDDLAEVFAKMELAQSPKQAAVIAGKEFVKVVNKLRFRETVRGASGEITELPGKLDVLFNNPADREAMIKLADFISKRAVRGAEGLGNSLARIGTALAAVGVPAGAALGAFYGGVSGAVGGAFAGALPSALYLGSLHVVSSLIARPGGIALLKRYFQAPTAAATANLIRLVTATNEKDFDPREFIGVGPSVAPRQPRTVFPVPQNIAPPPPVTPPATQPSPAP